MHTRSNLTLEDNFDDFCILREKNVAREGPHRPASGTGCENADPNAADGKTLIRNRKKQKPKPVSHKETSWGGASSLHLTTARKHALEKPLVTEITGQFVLTPEPAPSILPPLPHDLNSVRGARDRHGVPYGADRLGRGRVRERFQPEKNRAAWSPSYGHMGEKP